MINKDKCYFSEDEDPTFFSMEPDSAQPRKKSGPDPTPDLTLIRNEEKKYIHI